MLRSGLPPTELVDECTQKLHELGVLQREKEPYGLQKVRKFEDYLPRNTEKFLSCNMT